MMVVRKTEQKPLIRVMGIHRSAGCDKSGPGSMGVLPFLPAGPYPCSKTGFVCTGPFANVKKSVSAVIVGRMDEYPGVG